MAARNEAVFFAYLVAMPRQRFRCGKAFSTRCLVLWSSLSCSRCFVRFFFDGMTGLICRFFACSRRAFVSWPRSAGRYSALRPSIRRPACVQSALAPFVTMALSGIPYASTAGCILVSGPLLHGSCPDCHPAPLPHGDEPCNG